MKALLLLLFCWVGIAQADEIPVPKCWPSSGACSQAYGIVITEGSDAPHGTVGQCWQWYQPDDSGDFYEAAGYCGRWKDDLPVLASFTGGSLWAEYITRELSAPEQRAFDLLLINKPPSVYAVARDGSATTRPTYKVVSGKRQSTSNGRVDVGAVCRPSVLKLSSYADVSGQINRKNGQLLPANTVAVCAKR